MTPMTAMKTVRKERKICRLIYLTAEIIYLHRVYAVALEVGIEYLSVMEFVYVASKHVLVDDDKDGLLAWEKGKG